MGIPAYLSYIIRNYPGIVRAYRQRDGCGGTAPDNLYFDSNSIVYDAYRELLETDAVINDTTIIDKVILKIEYLIAQIRPQKNIFIALDGVAPFAKIAQQRQRRFRSAVGAASTSQDAFSTIKITPGTEFMKMLTFRLTRAFEGRGVIVSGSDVPGEGEHKIFEHIRSGAGGADDTYVIYGLDADLIMLAINHLYISKNMYIFRETPEYRDLSAVEEPYTLLDVYKLAKKIETHTGADAQSYIFLCFLLGNDFLPHFPALNLRTDGMDILLESYKKHARRGAASLIKNGRIQWRTLSRVLRDIAATEHELFKAKTRDRDKLERRYRNYFVGSKPDPLDWGFGGDLLRTKGAQSISPDVDPDLHLPVVRRELEKYICPEEEGWETRYYRVLFDDSSDTAATAVADDVQKRNVCLNLLHGLEWTFKYYCGNCVDWRWKYNYHYAPLLSDFVKYIPQFETDFFGGGGGCSMNAAAPLHPNVQLACVLPRKYLNLLPPKIREHIERKYLAHLYPDTIKQLWAYCRYNWEGHLILPEITAEFLDDIREFAAIET